ncbi:MAG: lycopene cyclase domain-containing protein [Gemmatimonadota bacterium]
MSESRYVWLIWASAFLLPWFVLWIRYPRDRSIMWRASATTMLFGLTEPIFVPEYWNPPSLFDLAHRTGFDLESFIFSFAIGGIGVMLYRAAIGGRTVPLPALHQHAGRHRYHRLALATAPVLFLPLWALPWNPIYAATTAMLGGAVAAAACRPDLVRNTLVGALLFLALYTLFMLSLVVFAPGYIERTWLVAELIPVRPAGIPIEELRCGISCGAYWSAIYEHLFWYRVTPVATARP